MTQSSNNPTETNTALDTNTTQLQLSDNLRSPPVRGNPNDSSLNSPLDQVTLSHDQLNAQTFFMCSSMQPSARTPAPAATALIGQDKQQGKFVNSPLSSVLTVSRSALEQQLQSDNQTVSNSTHDNHMRNSSQVPQGTDTQVLTMVRT